MVRSIRTFLTRWRFERAFRPQLLEAGARRASKKRANGVMRDAVHAALRRGVEA
jgi:hypothetical protein